MKAELHFTASNYMTKQLSFSTVCATFLSASALLVASPAFAQQLSAASGWGPLPDAPSAVLAESSSSSDGPQTASPKQPAADPNAQPQYTNTAPPKRLFYIIPNFRSVNTSTVLPPQSVKDKFTSATQDTFDYSALILEVALAGYNYGLNKTPEFGSGAVAYGRYLWHATADQSIENYMVEFIVPTIAHEDTRFYQLGHGGFKRRAIYSLTRTLITRSDSGKERINTGELVGAAAAGGISQTYYPRAERSAGNFLGQYGTSLFIDAASYFLREFEPEISKSVFRQKPTVVTQPGKSQPTTIPKGDDLLDQ